MIAIRELYSITPINVMGKYSLRMLTFKDLDWYIHNCREPYYNKYLDFSFAKDVAQDKLQSIFYNLVVGYAIKATNVSEARLVLVDNKSNEIIGGCTIFEKEHKKEYEIAYFIIPKMQCNGLGESLLLSLMSAMKFSILKFEHIDAIVMSSNTASIKLLEKTGFKKTCEYVGRRGINYVYRIHTDDIKQVSSKPNTKGKNKRNRTR